MVSNDIIIIIGIIILIAGYRGYNVEMMFYKADQFFTINILMNIFQVPIHAKTAIITKNIHWKSLKTAI